MAKAEQGRRILLQYPLECDEHWAMPELHMLDLEEQRLRELDSYSILDTLPEEDYDNLTSIAAEICGTPISLVSLIDDHRQWFKSHHGLDINETPKEYAFCAHAIQQPKELFFVSDAREDHRFFDNPLVTGEPHVVFYAGIPLVNTGGHALGTLCVIDHSPKKLTEKQVSALKSLSQQVVNLMELRRNREQLQRMLQQQQQRNSELEQFAFVAAHDIKSPLNNITELSEILQSEYASCLDEDANELITLMNRSSTKLKSMVDGLLQLSRSENLTKTQISRVDLSTLLADLELLHKGNQNFYLRLETSLEYVEINTIALEQILINLVTNALKYNDKPVPDIKIGVSETDRFYQFHVQDNGPGIPEKYHTKVFELFKVVAQEDRHGEKGNGIGLATVKKLVENLGGQIHIAHSPIGARFEFTIPKHR